MLYMYICIKAVSINLQSGIYILGIRKQLSDRCHTHLEADVAKLAAIVPDLKYCKKQQ